VEVNPVLLVYIIGAVLWLGYQAIEDARGNVEFNRYTLIQAVIWPFWLAFVLVVVLVLMVIALADVRPQH
jgi:hypothetical protein